MSKLNPGLLQSSIEEVLKGSKTKKRHFNESVDLFVNLKNYDTTKDKRFAGSVKLPRVARPKLTVCVIADAHHEGVAEKVGLPHQSMDDLKKLNKNKKLVKKMCKKYDVFLASESVIKTIPRVVGPHMNRAGKFPTSVAPADNLKERVNELRSTIKFQLKKVLCLGCCVGHVRMKPDDLRLNVTLAINFLVSLLKKNWQNLKSVYIKSTMGTVKRIY
eukprot:NODE_353_length_915_cov_475.374365_g345_i0.p1 GENE.NODE_353_length_915_cov_475.374365_g345_i0~~NODE_353_length_915_cov_475.374365_g345_i0.p1  ORF type:complete len:217 (+),score=33.00 NODE_353_length_915_cov_475.374365_g345_i0:64-714(+)